MEKLLLSIVVYSSYGFLSFCRIPKFEVRGCGWCIGTNSFTGTKVGAAKASDFRGWRGKGQVPGTDVFRYWGAGLTFFSGACFPRCINTSPVIGKLRQVLFAFVFSGAICELDFSSKSVWFGDRKCVVVWVYEGEGVIQDIGFPSIGGEQVGVFPTVGVHKLEVVGSVL